MKKKPAFKKIRLLCPDVPEKVIRDHLARLDSRYFTCFTIETIAFHIKELAVLPAKHPVKILFEADESEIIHCTILAYDYPYVFSFITGVLASMGFNIRSGDIFTYSHTSKKEHTQGKTHPFLLRRNIIDNFAGKRISYMPEKEWQESIIKYMEEVFEYLEGSNQTAFSIRQGRVDRAKQRVNEMVSHRLGALRIDTSSILFPITITIDNKNPDYTIMQIVSQDTPFFLYSLSNALSVQKISIERVIIRTQANRIEDEFCIVDVNGEKISDPHLLDQVKLAVLLTKQFTYFLPSAPDPFSALSRFETLVQDILKLPEQGKWFDLLSNPRIMQDLARLLGASDFLWEDFIRVQYENLIPMFYSPVDKKKFSRPLETLDARLHQALSGAETYEEKRERLNEFKNTEIYLMDLDHILTPGEDFKHLSERLTCLAESVIQAAMEIAYEMLIESFGTPATIAGIPVRFAFFGLGKTGGAALGYASDIELLLIYSDSGTTNGRQSLSNSDFFERLVKSVMYLVKAKREGIFRIDMRLRPYGKDGPLACSLQSFCQYYGHGGRTHALEKLALVRLRVIAGDKDFGSLVEQVRDEMIYFAKEKINVKQLRKARELQYSEKTIAGIYNAKFSPGALVDLEYDVQLLQVTYGNKRKDLRTPRLHKALEALAAAGVLREKETEQLTGAYDFFRRLINGLRMLRGSALDLTLPPVTSIEYNHLAQRTGYKQKGTIRPALQLHLDFETTLALVRMFIEHHFGRKTLPGPVTGNAADLVLSDNPPEELITSILSQAGFKNINRAFRNLKLLAGDGAKNMSGNGVRKTLFARLSILAVTVLIRTPDPDMALNNWERYCHDLENPEGHFHGLLEQPMRLEILLSIFSTSQYLSQILIQNPQFLDKVTEPGTLHPVRNRENLEKELKAYLCDTLEKHEWLHHIRLFKKQEVLRTGIRDICLRKPVTDIIAELTSLAEVLVQAAFEKACNELLMTETPGNINSYESCTHFCILAFGKCGGSELNYSSDIDLIAFFDNRAVNTTDESSGEQMRQFFTRLMGKIVSILSEHTEQGYVYRVDLRLRPYGSSGRLVYSFSSLVEYYEQKASLWEIQALLKLRPVAGNICLGDEFISRVFPLFAMHSGKEEIIRSIDRMRHKQIQSIKKNIFSGIDVKSGTGGIRDIEFLTQGLQLINIGEFPGLYERNTLKAIDLLGSTGILPKEVVDDIKKDYIFLRRVEHFLQIYEDRQVHSLPEDPAEREVLARKLSGTGISPGPGKVHPGGFNPNDVINSVEECLARVRGYYERYLSGIG
ncbi:MAG: glutamate-ammonia-ligase adenylyltransferase [Spirochaetales bacterium]|nr:glutamate-ammonia-ligase adenylyltransferase [Spirochaetales bacterium]